VSVFGGIPASLVIIEGSPGGSGPMILPRIALAAV